MLPLATEVQQLELASKQAQEIFTAKAYENRVVEFPYNGKIYRFRLIHDPSALPRVRIDSEGIKARYYIAPEGGNSTPEALTNLVGKLTKAVAGIYIGCGTINGKTSFDWLASQTSVETEAEQLALAEKQASNIFASDSYVNHLVEFPYNGKIYCFRLIHDPSVQGVRWTSEGVTARYCIAPEFSEITPDPLIDHVKKLTNATSGLFVSCGKINGMSSFEWLKPQIKPRAPA